MPPRTATTKPKSTRPSPKRDHLVNVAEDLFDRYGFFGTGVDRLVADSGVARMTFYKHFPTKNALVRKVLEQRDARQWAYLDEAVERVSLHGVEPVLAAFDALGVWSSDEGAQGCLLLRAVGEFCNHDVAVAGDAAFRKRRSGAWFQDLLEKRGTLQADVRCWDLALLWEGAIALTPVMGGVQAAGQARHAASSLLAAWDTVDER